MTGERLLTFVTWLALGLSHQAWALDEEIIQHPDQAVVEEYRANEQAVERLRTRIARTRAQDDRISAFRELAWSYPLAAEITARSYVADEDVEIAFTAVQILKGATVMSDHSMQPDRAVLPRVAYVMDRHRRSVAALRPAVIDRRDRIRQGAVMFLASLSDTAAFDMIVKDESGLYSDVQIANLFTLASGEVAQIYLRRYLGKGEIDAQKLAIRYLSAFTAYHQEIRKIYFLNRDVPTELRKYSALELSKNDTRFSDYALDIVGIEDFDTDLLRTVLSIIQNQYEQHQIDFSVAIHYSNSLKTYTNGEFSHVPTNLVRMMEELSQRLDVYSGRFRGR